MFDLLTKNFSTNLLLLLILLIYLSYRYLTRNFNFWKNLGIPYVKPTPFFGNIFKIVTLKQTIGHFLADLYTEMNQPYFGIWILGTPTLVITCPDLVKSVLQNDFDHFSNRTVHCDEKNNGIESNMLFFQRDQSWRESRKRLTAAFTSGKLKSMLPLINDSAKQMVDHLTTVAVPGNNLEAKTYCTKYTTSVIASCAFGLEADCFGTTESGFMTASKSMFKLDLSNAIRSVSYFFVPQLVEVFRFSFVKPEITRFLKEAFTQTITLRESTKVQRHDLVEILLQIKEDLKKENKTVDHDDMKIIAQAMQFYLAGFETSSSTIGFTLYEMCLNRENQNKLRQEILTNVKKFGGITYEALANMKYLDQCISETLRKYPVLPFLDRRCMRDYPVPGSDVIIPKGTPVYIPMFGLHYDPNFFPDPERYDPDRFTDENVRGRHQFCYLPFGQGPHNCIGERFGLITTKIGLVHILTNFEVAKNKKTPVPVVFDTKSFILQSTVGLPMTFAKIDNK